MACEDKDLARWLLGRGADPNATNGLDITPLSIAVQDASLEIIHILFDFGGFIKRGQLLHFAARRVLPDRVDILVYLLEKGAPVNGIMFQNCTESYDQEKHVGLGTPLHSAAQGGHLDLVETLLLRGANPLIQDSNGRLAVDKAQKGGFGAIVGLLRTSHD